MLVTALVTKAELVALVESLTPLRFAFDGGPGRSLTIGRPQLVLVPGKGLRLRGNARLEWEVAGITVPVTLRGWQLLLVPKVVTRGTSRLLALEPVVEDIGLKLVRGFLDDKITATISDWTRRYQTRLAWDFARTLTRRWPLSHRISPHEIFELDAIGGEVDVTTEELRFSVRFEGRIARGEPTAAEKELKRPSSASPSDSPGGKPRRRPSSPRVRA